MLEDFGDMEIFSDLGVDCGIFLVTAIDNGMEFGAGNGILRGEQGDIPAADDEPFSNITGDSFPRAVVAGRSSPSDGRENRDFFASGNHAGTLFLLHGSENFIEADGGEACGIIRQAIGNNERTVMDSCAVRACVRAAFFLATDRAGAV